MRQLSVGQQMSEPANQSEMNVVNSGANSERGPDEQWLGGRRKSSARPPAASEAPARSSSLLAGQQAAAGRTANLTRQQRMSCDYSDTARPAREADFRQPAHSRKRQEPAEAAAAAARRMSSASLQQRRSNSQDSLSSTDTSEWPTGPICGRPPPTVAPACEYPLTPCSAFNRRPPPPQKTKQNTHNAQTKCYFNTTWASSGRASPSRRSARRTTDIMVSRVPARVRCPSPVVRATRAGAGAKIDRLTGARAASSPSAITLASPVSHRATRRPARIPVPVHQYSREQESRPASTISATRNGQRDAH